MIASILGVGRVVIAVKVVVVVVVVCLCVRACVRVCVRAYVRVGEWVRVCRREKGDCILISFFFFFLFCFPPF